MPNLIAHYLLVKRFSIKADEENFDSALDSPFIIGNFDALALGTQGPDPFFYIGIVPFHAPHLLTAKKRLGNKIHKTDAKKYFQLLINRCHELDLMGNQYVKNLKIFQSFVLGQFAHYLLDREVHPFVLYQSGFDEDGKITGIYHYLHAHYESQIDSLLLTKSKLKYFLSHPGDVIPYNSPYLKVINDNLVPVLRKFFNDDHIPKNAYICAVKNMHAVVNFMNHHGKLKSKIVGKNSLGALYMNPETADSRVLNSEKESWKDPVTGTIRNESFSELSNRAASILESCYYDILKNGFNYEVFNRYINGLDYYGEPVGSKWTYKRETLITDK